MVSMVLVPYGINPNFDIVPRVMVTSLRIKYRKLVLTTLRVKPKYNLFSFKLENTLNMGYFPKIKPKFKF
ncbi:hypothetical protein BpHYR1_007811 [Brachionus plicatilis]|uniref:Uncharacterized protein n=1 Tax=Brachionus plicatilis TaxID=10195 RepID=A0A3M7QIH9_BRAPC|nr:hypothetical protein BpHYR1_007811 [Brachionus plicatilis]